MARTKSSRRRTCPARVPPPLNLDSSGSMNGSTLDMNATVAGVVNTSYGGTISSDSSMETESVGLEAELEGDIQESDHAEIELEPTDRSLVEEESVGEVDNAPGAADAAAGDVSVGDSAVGSETADGGDSSFQSCTSGTRDTVNGDVNDSNVTEDPPVPSVTGSTVPDLHACVSMISDSVHLQKAMTLGGVVDSSVVSTKIEF